MKVVIQQRGSGLFLAPDGTWIASRQGARDFRKSSAAMEFCIKTELLNVWIVLTFADSTKDFHLDPFREMTPKTRSRKKSALP